MRRRHYHSGMELTMVIIIMGMISAIGLAVLQMVSAQNKLSSREIRQQQTFQVAEAGVNYYRWRLAHYPNDYKDGTNAAGPYIHDFRDATGQIIGRYELSITPPVTGSTIATIISSGYLLSQPNARRTITVKLGLPSLSKYAVVANADMRFGAGTETFGPVHSNGGIHFDGIAHGLVSSAQTTYTDTDHDQNGNIYGLKPGVWSLNNETATFLGGKQVGVPAVNFNGITVDLAALKTLASSSGGLLLPSSSAQGYHLTFRTDDKVDIRKVVAQLRCQYNNSGAWKNYGFCSNNYNAPCSQDSTCGGGNACIFSSFSIGTGATDQVVYQLGVPLPANGIIFVPEDTWVDGTIDSARVTVVAAADLITTGNANIYVNDDLKYTHIDGQDVIGLIAQNNILTGYFSKDNITIDAALIAQKGRVGRPYYGAGFTNSTNNNNFRLFPVGSKNPAGTTTCQEYRKRSSLTAFGSLATNQRYGFAWVAGSSPTAPPYFSCGGGLFNDSGYCGRTLNFDSNLTFAPPPSFPTSGEYSIISYIEQ